MKVEHIMTKRPATCGPHASLADAARLMWDADCGLVPIVAIDGRVLDVLTDRDICIAAAARGRALGAIEAGDVVRGGPVISCRPEHDLGTALGLMTDHRIRRLPVIDAQGTLLGVLSIDDVVAVAGRKKAEVSADDLLAAMKAILGRALPEARRRDAGATAALPRQR